MHYCLNETQTKLKKMKRRKKSSSNKTTKWKLESSHSSHLRSRFVISCSEFKTAQAKMNQSHSQSKKRKRGEPSGEHRIKNKSTREKKINIQNRSWIDDEERNFKRKSTICTIHKWIVIWLCSDWCRLSTTLCIFTMNCYQTKMKFKIIKKKITIDEETKLKWKSQRWLEVDAVSWIVVDVFGLCVVVFFFISSRT